MKREEIISMLTAVEEVLDDKFFFTKKALNHVADKLKVKVMEELVQEPNMFFKGKTYKVCPTCNTCYTQENINKCGAPFKYCPYCGQRVEYKKKGA